MKCLSLVPLLLAAPLSVAGEAECAEQHFCSCPPFLRAPGTGGRQLHFTKHNYGDQYAIMGKSKELHCCLGPEWDSLQWSKDGQPFPWGGDRRSVLYSNNQSLIIMEVREGDSGTYTCEGRRGAELLRHSTLLRSFPAPVFSHPPIWNSAPGDVRAALGRPATLYCAATVGQQYNTVSMEPVRAAWMRFGREVESVPGRVTVEQRWTDDDIVTHLTLTIQSLEEGDAGQYICRMQTGYGVLEGASTVHLVTPGEGEGGADLQGEVQELLGKQMEVLVGLTRLCQSSEPGDLPELLMGAGSWMKPRTP